MPDHDGATYRMREMTVVSQRRGRRAVRVQHWHRVQHAGSGWQKRSHVIGCRQLVVQYDAEDSQTGHALNVRPRWRQRHLTPRRENNFLRLVSVQLQIAGHEIWDWRPKRPEGVRTCSAGNVVAQYKVLTGWAYIVVDGRRLPKLVCSSRSFLLQTAKLYGKAVSPLACWRTMKTQAYCYPASLHGWPQKVKTHYRLINRSYYNLQMNTAVHRTWV